ncbi:MAG: ABC transporter permease [Cyclobacteriaceae bacterium]
MLLTYLNIAWRHITRDKVYTAIVVFGLSISLAVALLVLQYARYELHYESFFKDASHISRVTTESYENKQLVYRSSLSSPRIADALRTDFPEVKEVVGLQETGGWFTCTLKYGEGPTAKIFNENSVFYTESSFFRVFSWPLINGALNALDKPFSVVITESTAQRYFGKESPLGKTLHLRGSFDENDYTVTGVMPDLPENSHLKINALFSKSSLEHNRFATSFDSYTYVLLSEGGENTLDNKMPALSSRLFGKKSSDLKIIIQPIKDVHLDQQWQDEMKPSGSAKSIYFLLIASGFILMIALINYINLATSRALERAKEVGVRKVSGALRSQLVRQFFTESFLIYIISFVGAVAIVMTCSEWFFKITGLPFTFSTTSFPQLNSTEWLILSLILLIIIIAAFYPARMISSFNPVVVLKGRFTRSQKGLVLRKSLVVFQFVCSISLMIGVYVMHDQFIFMQNQNLGFNIEGTLIIKAPSNIVDESCYTSIPRFRKQLEDLSFVNSVTTSSAIPGQKITWLGNLRKGLGQPVIGRNFSVEIAEPEYLQTYNLKIIAGKNFRESDFPKSRVFGSKVESILLNAEAVRQLGYASPEEAVDKIIYWDNNKCTIVGVVADYHHESLKSPIHPMLLTANIGPNMSIKLNPSVKKENLQHALSLIHAQWNAYFPDSPFDYFFLDDFFQKQYSEDKQIMHLFDLFCGLGILVSCLGLLGLSLFAAKQRTKEIGIRKVLGATVFNIVSLLTKEFLKPVLLSSCIALPLAYIIMERWLNGFAFHMELKSWQFMIPVAVVFIIAMLTISLQTTRASVANPTDSLKHE